MSTMLKSDTIRFPYLLADTKKIIPDLKKIYIIILSQTMTLKRTPVPYSIFTVTDYRITHQIHKQTVNVGYEAKVVFGRAKRISERIKTCKNTLNCPCARQFNTKKVSIGSYATFPIVINIKFLR